MKRVRHVIAWCAGVIRTARHPRRCLLALLVYITERCIVKRKLIGLIFACVLAVVISIVLFIQPQDDGGHRVRLLARAVLMTIMDVQI